MNTVDTIAAVATGTGGAIAIVRISGSDALRIGNQVWSGRTLLNYEVRRKLLLGTINSIGDQALAVYLPGPKSYTGEDTVELQCHGGRVAAEAILQEIFRCGARSAEPGEFTYRAFLNGKMDLTQAEAVADVIAARGQEALHLAERQCQGALKEQIVQMREQILHLLSDIESRLDFPDEELELADYSELLLQRQAIVEQVKKLLKTRESGILYRDGVRVALVGEPNAGKSSLLNRLLGVERAIVTAVPGTTRDTLEEYALLRNIPVKLVDTAGLRETGDEIEAIGVERALQVLESAQIVLWIIDGTREFHGHERLHALQAAGRRVILVANKADLPNFTLPSEAVAVSALDGSHLEELLNVFERLAKADSEAGVPEIAVNRRHGELLATVLAEVERIPELLKNGELELAAPGLNRALTALDEITGEQVSPDVLDNIFRRFCIGK